MKGGQRTFPVRLCAGCQRRDAQDRMIRFTVADGRPVPDRGLRAPGRGAYLHPARGCLDAFLSRKAFVRSVRASIAKPERAALVEQVIQSRGGCFVNGLV